jgi:predicted NBD/HSP70 family sugar kinase
LFCHHQQVIITVTLNAALDVTYRVPSLRPHTTHRVLDIAERPGGKGLNVARVLADLGHRTVVTGFAGGPAGAELRSRLATATPADLLTDPLVPTAGPTRRTVGVVDSATGDTTMFNEPGPTVSPAEWASFVDVYRGLLGSGEAGAVALCGSLPPGVPVDFYARLIRYATKLGVPVLLDNDANLGALAEHWWGAGRGVDDLVYLEISTGVGSGHIIGGKVYRGANGVAGELGHLPIDLDGTPCECGNRGCLTHLVSKQDVVARALALRGEHPESPLCQGEATIAAIEEAAAAGDRLALKVVDEAVGYLAVGIAGMLNLFNPSMVIGGGGLARLGDILVVPLRRAVQERTRRVRRHPGALQRSGGRRWRVALGAATFALETALNDVGLFPAARPAVAAVPEAVR